MVASRSWNNNNNSIIIIIIIITIIIIIIIIIITITVNIINSNFQTSIITEQFNTPQLLSLARINEIRYY